uniref:L1 cell adhesion molecule n=1 Tax=Chrysemys picta bellii TaxID=8478 RepID=A0A8C3HWU9_CHRPI
MAPTRGQLLQLWPLLFGLAEALTIPKELRQPPEMMEQPAEKLVVFPSDDIVLRCEATGTPPLEFRWTKDGRRFDPRREAGVTVVEGSGTLYINNSNAGRHQGIYRCYASNDLGTAMGPEIHVIPPEPSCSPPHASGIVHIAQDERVSMGQDGYLYFANVRRSDSHPDYICHAHYLGPRTIIQKEPIELRVRPTNSVKFRQPRMMVPPGESSSHVALRGSSLALECIAEGFPTPTVEWIRLNGPLPAERTALENSQKTLLIRDWAGPGNGRSSGRGWGSGRDTGRLCCPPSRISPPELAPDSARMLRSGALILTQVQPNDSLVTQCEAVNRHGRLLANAYIYVIQLPAKILTPDEQRYAVVENQTASLDCQAFGAPMPSVEWFTERMEPALQDERAFVHTNGTLHLSRAQRQDTGAYVCLAQNDQNNVTINAWLEVKGATRIVLGPQSAVVKKFSNVTFQCRARFDETLPERGVEWRRDGRLIQESDDSDKEGRGWCVGGWDVGGGSGREGGGSGAGWGGGIPPLTLSLSPPAPERYPEGVAGEGNETDNMLITWKPLNKSDWNAPELSYRVQWRRLGEGGSWSEETVSGPPLLVTKTPTFVPYEIKVQAVNPVGKGPEPPTVVGYSGEDVPQVNPENVGVEIFNSTSVLVSWTLPNRDQLRGHLRGFRVFYWRLGSVGERSRRQAWAQPPPLVLTVVGEASRARLGGLRPWSWYRLYVVVFNGRSDGPHSEDIDFSTPEGVPSPPSSLLLERVSDTVLALEWTPPQFPNGALTEYLLQYQQGESGGCWGLHPPLHPTAPRLPRVARGPRPPAPQLPRGSRFPHTWMPAPPRRGHISQIPRNGATPLGLAPCPRLCSHPSRPRREAGKHGWGGWGTWEPFAPPGLRVAGPHPRWGTMQQMGETEARPGFVPAPGEGSLGNSPRRSAPPVLTTDQRSFATEGWFIGFICAVILLLLLLLVLCFVKRSKVKDKEDTQVDSEARPMKDETFGEYSDNEEKPFGSSQPSLNGALPALGSEDSLADYGGSVDVQFNEDGSFIGQYSGHTGKEPAGNDSSGATSPTNATAALE